MIVCFKYLALIPVYLPGRGEDIIRQTTSTTTTAADEDRFYVFDFLNANSGISIGGGGRTVAATVKQY